MRKRNVIFVCTGNCFRSQMAEGMMRHIAGDRMDVYSAGSQPAGFVHPLAIEVMNRIGIDIGKQTSKSLKDFAHMDFDYVITLCDRAMRQCSTLRGRKGTYHWPLEDPTTVLDDIALARQVALRVRGELRDRLTAMLKDVLGAAGAKR